MTKITLTNDFHDTSVTLNVKNGEITEKQMKRAHRELCGNKNCKCSGDFGYRGKQKIDGIEPIFNSDLNKVVGGIVHF